MLPPKGVLKIKQGHIKQMVSKYMYSYTPSYKATLSVMKNWPIIEEGCPILREDN
jgi:hypothetical protein